MKNFFKFNLIILVLSTLSGCIVEQSYPPPTTVVVPAYRTVTVIPPYHRGTTYVVTKPVGYY